METTFELDARRALSKVARVSPAAVIAVSRAGGDGIRAMKAASVKRVRGRKAIKAGKLSGMLDVSYPTAGDVKFWRLRIPAETMPVIAYPTRQTKKGVSVLINIDRRALIPHAFIATMKSGHLGVFMRVGSATRAPVQRYRGRARYAGQRRQPIKELFTTRVVDVFRDRGFIEDVMKRGEEVFRNTYHRVLLMELAKGRV